MNNKGMTLVELLVTFSLLLVIIVGMFNLIMKVKNDFDDKRIGKDFTEYSSNMNSSIQYDLIKNKPFAILYKNNASDPWTSVSTRGGYDFASSDNNTTYVAKYSGMSSENIKPAEKCHKIYPCLIYAYVDNNKQILTKTIGLNKGDLSKSDLSKSDVLAKSGIYYNDVFESIPNQEFVDIQDSSSFSTDEDDDANDGIETTKVEIVYKKNEMLVINFPYRLVEHDENYGFKIVYPFFAK